MAKDLFFPGTILGIHKKAVDKLLAAGSGDAALLYLALLAGKDGGALAWDRPRLEAAHRALLELGLADPKEPVTQPPPQKLEDSSPPVYSTEDARRAMDQDAGFLGLVKETERQLGRSLVTQDVKDLLYLTDYLGLPPPVVLLLVRYCLDTQAPGARLTLRQIKNQGHKWYDAGVRTLADADSHIARMAQRRDRHRTLLALLDRPGRPPMRQEAAYLDAWLDMGFQDEVIRQAYERTVFQVGELKWGYMNGILKSWHDQGLHTLAEVQAAERKYRRRKPQGGAKGQSQAPAAPQPQTPVDTSDLDRFLARMEQKKKEGT